MIGMLMMVRETFAQRLTRIRKAKGISKYRLAIISGIAEAYIYQLEAGGVRFPQQKTAEALAAALNVSVPELLGLETEEYESKRVIEELKEMLRTAKSELSVENSGDLDLTLLGYVPAGYPLPNSQENLGKISVPRYKLGAARDSKNLFALIVSGDSLIGDLIYPGDKVIVNPEDKDLVPGKIYLVRVENEVTIKKVVIEEDKVLLQSSNGKYPDMAPDHLEVLGRVILSGNWRER